jgi:mono/diheme cytochrome c family protein
MQWTIQRSLIFAVLLNANLFFAGCHTKSENTTHNVDPSETKQSIEVGQNVDTVLIKQGQALFRINCNKCHAIFKTDNFLEGVVQRLGEHYLKLYLTRQDSLTKVKDKHALEVKEIFGNLGNSHNFDFSEEQLNAIIAYLKKYSS